ncbi:MAG: hypothetical protein VW397_05870 [Candidatus Margulisiibacteriota bacterium]
MKKRRLVFPMVSHFHKTMAVRMESKVARDFWCPNKLFFNIPFNVPVLKVIDATPTEPAAESKLSTSDSADSPIHKFNKQNNCLEIQLINISLVFFRPTSILESDPDFREKTKYQLQKKSECKEFANFYRNKIQSQDKDTDKDNLTWLLPLITLFEDVNEGQYEKINNFLMPIWKFNYYTAKEIFKHNDDNGVAVLKYYVTAIIEGKELDDCELRESLIAGILRLKGINDPSPEEKGPLLEDLNKNIQDMRKVFFNPKGEAQDSLDPEGEAQDSDKHKIYTEWLKSDTPKDYKSGDKSCPKSYYQYLFLEFFRGCIFEKVTEQPSIEVALKHRSNSGGCKLMVQGISEILDIGDPFTLIENFLPMDEHKERRLDDLSIQLQRILELEGEANIFFNDAISIAKEVVLGERDSDSVKQEISESKPGGSWFNSKIELYKKKLVNFSYEMTKFLLEITINRDTEQSETTGEDNDLPSFKNLKRYLMLISSAIIGVPIWSCKLTDRYFFLNGKVIQIQEISESIKSLFELYPNERHLNSSSDPTEALPEVNNQGEAGMGNSFKNQTMTSLLTKISTKSETCY